MVSYPTTLSTDENHRTHPNTGTNAHLTISYHSLHGFTNLKKLRGRSGSIRSHEQRATAARRRRSHIDIYRWVEWAVVDRRPFTFVERRRVRQNPRMGIITAKTYTISIKKLRGAVDQRVIKILPKKFGLVLMG
ncbi:hypothetical protein PC114_g24174 [Phytophthora cactorum]|uniref:Uncharacterized protein n=2 Tax=Phytophthora cactorum TaxID=29920 RepID=A0A8T1AXC1_9STRA|nr:hypothetical protein PC114_g24174 [Phytophthora cactorum]KAG2892216.1 hypothetical protein PC117_g24046 [Phytophthora cactorum]KAG3128656.1 hypothetical protein C6341_g24457 [Phytophthora cactorum]